MKIKDSGGHHFSDGLLLQQCCHSRSLPNPLNYLNGIFPTALALHQWLLGNKLQGPYPCLQFFRHCKNNPVFTILKLEISFDMSNMLIIFTWEARTIEVLNIKIVYCLIHILNKGNQNPKSSNKIKRQREGREYN